MATIAATNVNAIGVVAMVSTTLTASDTFTYTAGKTKYLVLDNVTAGSLTVLIDGDGATTQLASGVGSIDLTGGFSTGAIAASERKIIPLDSIKSYLAGVIEITGGTGIEASLLEE